MATKGRKRPVDDVDHAVPFLGKKPTRTDGQMVQTTRSTTEIMKGSGPWAALPELRDAVTIWNHAADSLERNGTAITNQRERLRAAEARQRALRRKWRDATANVLGAAQVACDGSPEAVKELGLEVRTQAPRAALPVLEELVTSSGTKSGEATVTWRRGRARHGFLVQTATDVATPTTYTAPIPVSKARFTLTEGVSKSIVHFRVAAIDPFVAEGHAPWSAWVVARVR